VPLENKIAKIDRLFPDTLENLLEECCAKTQVNDTPLIPKYAKGNFNTLHQYLYGETYSPLQAAIFLKEPSLDCRGGKFVMTQKIYFVKRV